MDGNHSPSRVKMAQHPQSTFDPRKAEQELRRFLDLVVREAHLQLKYEITDSKDSAGGNVAGVLVKFDDAEQELLLANQAELLLALEYLAHRWLRLEPPLQNCVRFDCGDFRELRLEELKLSARVAAQRVRETGQTFHFNPMPSGERRILHLELNSAADVRSSSEGMGIRRHVVIYPVKSK